MQHGEGREGKRLGVERGGEFVQKGTEEWEMRGWAAAWPVLPHNRCVMEVFYSGISLFFVVAPVDVRII